MYIVVSCTHPHIRLPASVSASRPAAPGRVSCTAPIYAHPARPRQINLQPPQICINISYQIFILNTDHPPGPRSQPVAPTGQPTLNLQNFMPLHPPARAGFARLPTRYYSINHPNSHSSLQSTSQLRTASRCRHQLRRPHLAPCPARQPARPTQPARPRRPLVFACIASMSTLEITQNKTSGRTHASEKKRTQTGTIEKYAITSAPQLSIAKSKLIHQISIVAPFGTASARHGRARTATRVARVACDPRPASSLCLL